MAAQQDVEDGQQRAGPLDKVAGQQGAEGEPREEAGVQVADGDAALRRRRAVARVGVAQHAAGGEGARQAVEEGAEDHPAVVHRLGIPGGQDRDDLGGDAAEGADDQDALAAVAVREGAELWRRQGAQGPRQDVEHERELGDRLLHLGDEALAVVAARDDGREGEARVGGRAFGKVVLAHEVNDSDDAQSQPERASRPWFGGRGGREGAVGAPWEGRTGSASGRPSRRRRA